MEQFKNTTYESENVDSGNMYKIQFDSTGKPTISIWQKIDEENLHGYGTYNEFYNVIQDTAAGSVYVKFNFKDLNGTGPEESFTLKYSNVSDNDEISLETSLPINQNNETIILHKVK